MNTLPLTSWVAYRGVTGEPSSGCVPKADVGSIVNGVGVSQRNSAGTERDRCDLTWREKMTSKPRTEVLRELARIGAVQDEEVWKV